MGGPTRNRQFARDPRIFRVTQIDNPEGVNLFKSHHIGPVAVKTCGKKLFTMTQFDMADFGHDIRIADIDHTQAAFAAGLIPFIGADPEIAVGIIHFEPVLHHPRNRDVAAYTDDTVRIGDVHIGDGGLIIVKIPFG